MIYIRSPINYTGNKYKLLKYIIPMFPKDIDNFFDVFGGSGTVTLNVCAKHKIYNEINDNIFGIIKNFKELDSKFIIDFIQNRINLFNLSKGKDKSKLITDDELLEYNRVRNNYLLYREFINSNSNYKNLDTYSKDARYLDFLTIHYFAFNNLIRTSKSNRFNTPAGTGSKHFILEQHGPLIENACNQFKKISILNKDFKEIDYSNLTSRDFVYFDPPYLLSNAEYNKLWNIEDEMTLYKICDQLSENGVRWAMSNMMVNNNTKHELLLKWCEKMNYNIYAINTKYSGWIQLKKNTYDNTKEVLITNYEIDNLLK